MFRVPLQVEVGSALSRKACDVARLSRALSRGEDGLSSRQPPMDEALCMHLTTVACSSSFLACKTLTNW